MKKAWLKEIARDLLALGSIPFYFLFVIRATIGNYNVFVYQLLIAAIVIFILYFLIRDSSMYTARSLVALIFSSIFYKDMTYTVFASLLWGLLLISAYYVKRNISYVLRGIIIGALSSLFGYYIAPFLV